MAEVEVVFNIAPSICTEIRRNIQKRTCSCRRKTATVDESTEIAQQESDGHNRSGENFHLIHHFHVVQFQRLRDAAVGTQEDYFTSVTINSQLGDAHLGNCCC